jgi:uncharacterized protein (DUF1499 family)
MIDEPSTVQFRKGGCPISMHKRLLLLPVLALILSHCTGAGSKDLGVTDGKLTPCPKGPNCVSSQSTDKSHYVDPLRYEVALNEATEGLLSLLRSMESVKIINAEEGYIHAEFTSALFRFVDDVEFYFDDGQKTIHVRSASRIGYYDFGVNRRRVEWIRNRLLEPRSNQHRKAKDR